MGRTTIAVTLKPEANREGQHVVRIRITKDRVTKFWSLSLTLPEKQFNENGTKQLKNWVRRSCYDQAIYNDRILDAYRRAEDAVSYFDRRDRPYTAVEVRDYLEQGGYPEWLLPFFEQHIAARIKAAGTDLGKLRTADTYKGTLKVLRWYLRELHAIAETVPDSAIDNRFWLLGKFTKKDVLALKAWLVINYAPNSGTTYLSNLRHVLYQAADAGLVSYEKFPMRGISLTTHRKKVQRLQESEIDVLATSVAKTKHHGGHPAVTQTRHAKSLALAMYYAHGARLGDAVMWRAGQYVIEGEQHRLRYTTGKSKKEMSVLLDEEAITLLEPYRFNDDGSPKKPTDLLFPYVPNNFDSLSTEEQYIALRRAKIRACKQIATHGERIGLTKRITPHVMRHSFADMMRRNGVALETRQEVLAHSDIKTTRMYEEQFDQQAVDAVSLLYQKRKPIGKGNNSKTKEKAPENDQVSNGSEGATKEVE